MDVALHFEVDRSTPYRWERGIQSISIDNIRRFVEFCGFKGAAVDAICKWVAYGGITPRAVASKQPKGKSAAA